LLIVHVVVILVYNQSASKLLSGENRYIATALNLIKRRQVMPWCGPGYPLFLFPFAVSDVPWVVARLANAAVLFVGFIYLFRALRYYVDEKWAYVSVYCLGLYPLLLEYSPRLFTEPFSVFLACGLSFHFIRMSRTPERRWLHLLIASGYLGFLVLTKVLFGYVVAAAILIFLVTFAFTRSRHVLRGLLVACLALAVCVPYLYRTYSVSGRLFYWSQAGGLSLYWMSTPFEEEYGDWISGTRPWLHGYSKAENHLEFFEEIQNLSPVERDQELRRQAIRNIIDHPGKFARNWLANLGRLFLHYPFSYTPQSARTLMYIIPGMVLVFLCVLSAIPTVVNWSVIPFGVRYVLLLGLIYVGGNSLLSAYNRMLLPVLPFLTIWITYIRAREGATGVM
jgi:hypothetical protein